MTKRRRGKSTRGKRGPKPSARLPLPAKTQARHGDATKYERTREKERLRREGLAPEDGQ